MGVASPEAVDSTSSSSFRPLQAIVALGAIQALTMLAGLARTKVLAVLLGPSGVGVASVIDQVVSLVAQLGSLSIPFVGLKFLARSRDDGSDETRRIYVALVVLLAIASVIAAALATGVAAARPTTFGDGLAAYRTVLLVALLGVPPFALAPLLRNAMAALERHRESAVAAFLSAVLTVAGAAIGVAMGGLVGLYVANAIVLLLTIAGMQWYLGNSLGLRLTGSTNAAGAAHALRSQPGLTTFAASMYVLALTSPLAYLYARSLLLSTHGAVEAGLVAAAYGIGVSIRLVLNQANGLYLTPLVNRNIPRAERVAAVAEYLRILIVLVVLSTLVFVLFPTQWLALLYSSKFSPAVSMVAVFVMAEATLLVAGVYQALLIGFDDIAGFLVSTVAGQLLTIALARWLVVPSGGIGVGIAFLAGNAVILVATATRLVQRHEGARVFAPLLPLLVALGATGVAGWWVTRASGPGALWKAIAYVGACGLAVLFLRPDERRWILHPWKAPSSIRSQ
jgi:O-antigen/teichoic acid export membrane protein